MVTKTASQLVTEAKARISNLTVDQVADVTRGRRTRRPYSPCAGCLTLDANSPTRQLTPVLWSGQ